MSRINTKVLKIVSLRGFLRVRELLVRNKNRNYEDIR